MSDIELVLTVYGVCILLLSLMFWFDFKREKLTESRMADIVKILALHNYELDQLQKKIDKEGD